MKVKYRKNRNTFSYIKYHFVFCTRYRRKIFYEEKLEEKFKLIVKEICSSINVEVLEVQCVEDYVHLVVDAPPILSPGDIMAKMKGVSSRVLREEFDNLGHLGSLWTREYLVSTEDKLPNEIIKEYVNKQKRRG